MIFDLYFGVERKFQGGISQGQILADAADICVPPKLCGFQFKAKCAGCKGLKGVHRGGWWEAMDVFTQILVRDEVKERVCVPLGNWEESSLKRPVKSSVFLSIWSFILNFLE